jgi:hypothetical protein
MNMLITSPTSKSSGVHYQPEKLRVTVQWQFVYECVDGAASVELDGSSRRFLESNNGTWTGTDFREDSLKLHASNSSSTAKFRRNDELSFAMIAFKTDVNFPPSTALIGNELQGQWSQNPHVDGALFTEMRHLKVSFETESENGNL